MLAHHQQKQTGGDEQMAQSDLTPSNTITIANDDVQKAAAMLLELNGSSNNNNNNQTQVSSYIHILIYAIFIFCIIMLIRSVKKLLYSFIH